MTTKTTQDRVQLEGRLDLACKAFNNHEFRSQRAAAHAFNVSKDTLLRRLRGIGPQQKS